MAKPKSITVGSVLETTLLLPPKSVLQELADAAKLRKKKMLSLSGTYGKAVAQAVQDHHVDRKALAIAVSFLGIEDQEVLHKSYFNLMHAFEVLGVTKMATAQEEMFAGGEMRGEPTGRFSDIDKDDAGADQGHARKPRQKAAAANGKNGNGKKKPDAKNKKGEPAPKAAEARTTDESAGDNPVH